MNRQFLIKMRPIMEKYQCRSVDQAYAIYKKIEGERENGSTENISE